MELISKSTYNKKYRCLCGNIVAAGKGEKLKRCSKCLSVYDISDPFRPRENGKLESVMNFDYNNITKSRRPAGTQY